MGDHLERCAWKLIAGNKFVLGIPADRCGCVATIRVIRPNRKTDLFLCEHHLNEFIRVWGLHNEVEVLCPTFKACLEFCCHPECVEYWGENEPS